MKFKIIFSILVMFILGTLIMSCMTVPSDTIPNSSGVKSEVVEAVVVDGVIDFTRPEFSFMWNTAPDNGKLLFSSFIPRRAFRDEEIELAILGGARQASIMYNSKVDARFAVKSNNRDLGYLEAIDIQYDKALAEDLKLQIKIRNHFIDNEGSYILAELDGVIFKGSFSDMSVPGEDPDWLYNIPVIPGYLVSVGSVQRSRYKIDSIIKADEQALANLAKQVSVIVKAKRTDRDSEVSGSSFNETNYEVTSTFVRGFYVLGRWSTDNGNTYHTLAICPVNQ